MSRSARLHPDGKTRCPWPGEDPFYVAYHDTEWGVPEYDDRALYEKLILDGFQAGLSWITILRKRDNFRRAFDDFQPEKIARYNAKKVHALMNDAGIVRNRAKIDRAILSARSYLDIMAKGPGFSKLLWDFMDGRPKVNHFKTTSSVPGSTPLSVETVRRHEMQRVDQRVGLAALLHDAPEYVIGDMISPFKAVLDGHYKAVEKRLLGAIHIRFGLPPVLPDEITQQIKAADRGAAYLEATQLAGFSESEAKRLFGKDPGLSDSVRRDYLTPWTAARAEKQFLERFNAVFV